MLTNDSLEPLRQGWIRLLGRYGVAPVVSSPVFDRLVAAYSAPHRLYHNLEHLVEMFAVADRLYPVTDDPSALRLAIWYHDAVYDPRAKDNEARSAELAAHELGPLGVPRAVLDRVASLVLATAHLTDTRRPGDRDTAVMLDADLAVLGAAEDRYRQYAADVRKEYDWVPDAAYREGRAGVLTHFLARPRLYWTDLLHSEREERARVNMRAELDSLRSPVGS